MRNKYREKVIDMLENLNKYLHKYKTERSNQIDEYFKKCSR